MCMIEYAYHVSKPDILHRCRGIQNFELWYMHMINACFQNIIYAYVIMHAFKPHIIYRCDGIKIDEMWCMPMIDACKFSNPMPWDHDVMILYICCET